MKNYLVLFVIICFSLQFTSCKTNKDVPKETTAASATGPHVIIYKTRADYFMHVPVGLSEDKKSLISYPAPGDVFYNGDLAYPIKLEDGFLLDRRGITPQSGFLNWTYYEYSRFDKTPSPDELLGKMLDTDPFTVIYDCGRPSQYKNMVNELNERIKTSNFDGFKRVK